MPRRFPVAAVVAALVLSGCVKPGKPDVGVNPLSADVVFGAPTTTGPAIIPETAPGQAPAQEFDRSGLFSPADARGGPRPGPNATPAARAPAPSRSTPGDACRVATVNDFAPEVSPDRPGDARPTPGIYRWKRSGTRSFTVPGATQEQTEVIRGFEERIVQNVTPYGGEPTDFEYETVQKDFSNNTVTMKWRVRQQAENRNVNSNFPPFRQNVGEPDRGLSLVSITVTTPTGANEAGFTPRTPLLYLPLKTQISDSWTSLAVDPRTFQSLELKAAVVRHAEVDACGEVVDGWLVEGTLTQRTGESEVESRFDYVVANQFGALVISTHQETPKEKPTSKLDFSIARTTPKPLPG